MTAPQFRVGGKGLKANFNYEVPMQLVMTSSPEPDAMISDLGRNWIQLNHYWPEPLNVRSNDEALKIYIQGRRATDLWQPGKGYRLESGDIHTVFIYIGEQGLNAYFDYLLYEMTGDSLWRKRAFEQMDFILKGQNTNPEDPNYGVVQTAYNLNQESPGGLGFNSMDRGTNPGFKPDINAHLARYMLLTWKRVKDHESVDRNDWYHSAILATNWVIRQQNNDGGLAQKVELQRYDTLLEHDWMGSGQEDLLKTKTGEKSPSAASGRALPSMWWIYKLTGDAKYKHFLDSLEEYTLKFVQNQYYYVGHHPDLPPLDFEEASVWGVAEYWLNRYEETHDHKYLDHAVADAYLALTWWCPKQLSWVKNPTLGGSSEQQHFLQYSVYSYQDRKPETIQRIADLTGERMLDAVAKSVFQNIYFTQVTTGNFMGATHERIADPWLARSDDGTKAGFNSMGTIYMGEQSLDAFLQIVEMYRTGGALYEGGALINKVYPDGAVFYSKDIGNRNRTDLSVLPSAGTINVTVELWTTARKKWTVSDATAEQIATVQNVGGLSPSLPYQVLEDGRTLGTFHANAKGAIQFTQSGSYELARTYEIVATQ